MISQAPEWTNYLPRSPVPTERYIKKTHLGTLAVAPKQHRLVVTARLGALKDRVCHAPGKRPHGEAGG